VLGGGNWFMAKTRNLRLNFQVIRVHLSPVSSSFGYYVGGQDGVTLALAQMINF
jgi:hypothetical protein